MKKLKAPNQLNKQIKEIGNNCGKSKHKHCKQSMLNQKYNHYSERGSYMYIVLYRANRPDGLLTCVRKW